MERSVIDALAAKCQPAEAEVLETLFSSWSKKYEVYKENDCKTNLLEWQAAEKALKAKISELEERYDAPVKSEPLANRLAAWRFLKNLGYKISQGKFYQDAESGLIKIAEDGTVTEEAARAYAERFLKKVKTGSEKNPEIDAYIKRIKQAEADKAEAQVERLRFSLGKEKELYLLRSDVETQFAIKWSALEAAVKHMLRGRAVDIITAIGGDVKKRDVFVEYCFSELDRIFNELAEIDEISVSLTIEENETYEPADDTN